MILKITVFLFGVGFLAVRCVTDELPDAQGCTTYDDSDSGRLDYICPGPFTPTHLFDVSLMPLNTTEFTLNCREHDTNLLVMPVLEHFGKLKRVSVCGFSFYHQAGSLLNISSYIVASKAVVEEVFLMNVTIGRIDRTSFEGMNNMKLLGVEGGGQDLSLDRNSFVNFGGLKLQFVGLHRMKLGGFDWETFEPLKDLEALTITHAGLTTIAVPSPDRNLTFPRIAAVDFTGNLLTTIPSNLFSFLPNLETLLVMDNRLCQEDAFCRCCDLKPMADWLLTGRYHFAALTCGRAPVCGDNQTAPEDGNCKSCQTRRHSQLNNLTYGLYDSCESGVELSCVAASGSTNPGASVSFLASFIVAAVTFLLFSNIQQSI